MRVPEHDRVADAADHARAGLLRERADDDGDNERDEERRMLRAGALRTEMEHGRNEQHQKQQTHHHGGERRPLERAGGVGALEVEAAAQEDDADADAEHEAEQTDHGVEVAAAETQHHAQRAAEEDERADHHERAEHEARGGRGARAGAELALEAGNTEAHVAGVSKRGQRQRRESHGDAGGKDKPVLFFHVAFSIFALF